MERERREHFLPLDWWTSSLVSVVSPETFVFLYLFSKFKTFCISEIFYIYLKFQATSTFIIFVMCKFSSIQQYLLFELFCSYLYIILKSIWYTFLLINKTNSCLYVCVYACLCVREQDSPNLESYTTECTQINIK